VVEESEIFFGGGVIFFLGLTLPVDLKFFFIGTNSRSDRGGRKNGW
jgi:hypothetical protein